MSKYNNELSVCAILYILFLLPVLVIGQECDIDIYGEVKDISTGSPISYANIYLKEAQSGTVTDSLGQFQLSRVCPDNYHLLVSHIGCKTIELNIDVSKDTLLQLFMDHNDQLLDEVTITSQGGKLTTQQTLSINDKKIAENTDKDLAGMLKNMSGVSIISNGSGISKPIIHGLYGNRLTILNNGVAQSGQQWGVDHSPEIDPLVANRITVVKGVGALEYQGNSLGSIILVEPEAIDQDPHLHGKVRYVFHTNGLGHGLNLDLQQNNSKLAWRAVGTFKRSGDTHTPDYYLRNTGKQEANFALQLEKPINERWTTDLYISSFNASYGVLRGSHIGNLTDLEQAFDRDVPFFTQDQFSYEINAPFQRVNHHLLKFNSRYLISNNQWIDFSYAGQYNLRKEFDVRRSGRSDIPALSLEQFSNFAEAKYQNYWRQGWTLKTGLQFNTIDNDNLPETGILPLIPNYRTYEYGWFGTLSRNWKKWNYELGARYDFEDRNVAAISNTVPREILRFENYYHNLSATGGVDYQLSDNWKLVYNMGLAERNPEVNELYSAGLHQGVSGIEEGDADLQKETSFKSTFSIQSQVKEQLLFESVFYFQQIRDYIFLNPQDEVRLTIRGAFPVFRYEQTDARIYGFDMAATYYTTKRFNIVMKYSYLRGDDVKNDLPLVFMPANRLYAALNYQVPTLGLFQNLEFQVNNSYVFEQNNLLDSQDFVAPPDAYNLLGMKITAERQLKKIRLNLFAKAENLLNVTYRDYLNRQRYFADDLGINIVFGLNAAF